MSKYLPAGCKDAKINLSGAYRTTFTHLQEGDVVRLDRRTDAFAGVLIPTPTHSPARSFWATVTKVERGNRRVFITTDKGEMPGDFAHASITRKERATEYAERLELDARAREDAVRASEEVRIQDALAAHPTPAEAAAMAAPVVPAIPFMCGSHAHRTQADRTECQATAARLTARTVPLADPEDLAADLVRIGRDGNIPEPITHALNVVGQLMDNANAEDRAYYGKVYAALQSRLRQAMKVASDAAMRQAEPKDFTHDFDPSVIHGAELCGAMVRRPSGNVEPCLEPVKSAIHDPAAYAAYHAELTRELAKLRTGELDVDSAFPAVASPDRTKLLNAEGTVRNLLADAKEDRRRVNARFATFDRVAQAAVDARVEALEQVLALLV